MFNKHGILNKINKYKVQILAMVLLLSLIGNVSVYSYAKNNNKKIQVTGNKIEQYESKVSLAEYYKKQLDELKIVNEELNNKNTSLEKEKLALQESNNKLQESNRKLEERNKRLQENNKKSDQGTNQSQNDNNNINLSSTDKQSHIVYITDTGSKYHSLGCRDLRKSCYEIDLSDAKAQGYTPCSVCNP